MTDSHLNLLNMAQSERQPIGRIGRLAQWDWLNTVATVNEAKVNYKDHVEATNDLAEELRADGADLVIAMTHMKWEYDTRLADCAEGLNLILGSHDHEYGIRKVNETWIVKSGSDVKNLTKIDILYDCLVRLSSMHLRKWTF